MNSEPGASSPAVFLLPGEIVSRRRFYLAGRVHDGNLPLDSPRAGDEVAGRDALDIFGPFVHGQRAAVLNAARPIISGTPDPLNLARDDLDNEPGAGRQRTGPSELDCGV